MIMCNIEQEGRRKSMKEQKVIPDALSKENEEKLEARLHSLYMKAVLECATNKTDLPIPNGSARNAAFLFQTFFNFGEKEICIYTGKLFEGIFGENTELIDAAKSFLRKHPKAELKIAYQEKISKEEIFGRKLVKSILDEQDMHGQLRIWDASSQPKKNHFAVMDQSAYRYELDHGLRTAIANFGNTENAQELHKDFEEITRRAELVYPFYSFACSDMYRAV